MKRLYTIAAYSKISLQYKNPSLVFIEPGMNAVLVLTDDINSFIETLKTDGVRVDQINLLNGLQDAVSTDLK